MRTTLICTAILAVCALPASAEDYGTIKGKVVFSGNKIPPVGTQNVTKDQQHCLGKGPILKDDLLIDANSKGVKNVMIWLADAPDGKIDSKRINPKLAAVPATPVIIDQPRCAFVPRITMMRAGQPLEIHNSAPIAHNTRISGNPEVNGTVNLNIPPGQKIVRAGATALKAEKRPLLVNCDIHGWMGGRIGVFNHPYFAITKEDGSFEIKDVPAGKILIFMQHERAGWLQKGRNSKGESIDVPAGGTLDLKTIKFKPEYLNE
jgi:hypothetical protein